MLFRFSLIGEYLLGVGFRVDFADDVLYDAFFVDENGLADSTHRGFPVHLLFAPGSVGLQDFGGWVGNETERQRVLLDELAVGGLAVFALNLRWEVSLSLLTPAISYPACCSRW